ncbi:MAG: class I SAM-dependent RNA methyltransferase [Treponema sp.]|nr:class I SAM-dependent RNA methyltransferase [Treponema sp.]
MQKEMNAAALCAVGAEKAVSNEIRKIGLKVEESGFGRVRFRADTAGLYRALMGLRAADRVLLEIGCFPAEDFDALFEETHSLPWEEIIPAGMGLKVAKVRTNRSKLKAEVSIQAVVHKAAAARLCEKHSQKRLPEWGDQAELRVYIEKDKASILLDLSGEPLFKRGYRGEGRGGIAPLRETTAAAIILLSGWKRKFPLYDPFCGSGTIAVEAALYAWDIAPGLGRGFVLEKLLIADKKTEKKIRDELYAKIDFTRHICISGSDADNRAVQNAQTNLERALKPFAGKKPACMPEFHTLPMEDIPPQAGLHAAADSLGFIITNPPYGKRLEDQAAAEKNYAGMGGLARQFEGWKLVLITDHPGFESFFGRKAVSCREITNGAILSYLFQYDKL